jgi:hypothetical protein
VRARTAVLAGLVGLGIYSAAVLSLAGRAHLWNDELYTWYFAQLPTMRDVWDELSTGVEQLPPFFYVVTRLSLTLFGDNAVALRLPSLFGLALACACLAIVVGRRTNAWYGCVAALIPLGTGVFRYAWEARPYALLVGFAALALLSWQLHGEGVRPRLTLLGLALALAAATAVQYYGILVVLPIVAGEAVRTSVRRSVEWPMLAAFCSPLAPLALAFPLLEGARTYQNEFWTDFNFSSAPRFYVFLLRGEIFSAERMPEWLAFGFTAVVLGGALLILLRRPVSAPDDVAAAVGFALLPLAGVLVGELFTGAYTERYVLPAVLGPAMLIPLALNRVARGRKVAIGAAMLLVVWFVVVFQYWQRDVSADLHRQRQLISFLESETSPGGLPVAVGHPHDYLELAHYAPRVLAERLIRVSDPDRALQLLGSRSSEDGMVVLSRFAPLRVVAYGHEPSRFLLLLTVRGRERDWNWIEPALRADHYRLRTIASDDADGFRLLQVDRGP